MTTNLQYSLYISRLLDFQDYIKSNLPQFTLNSITTSSSNPTNKSSTVILDFTGTLTSNDIDTINTFVTSYVDPTTPEIEKTMSITLNNTKVTTSAYTLVGSFFYEGSKKSKNFQKINVSSCNISSGYTYSIRLWNTIDKTVICELTGLNHHDYIIDSTETINNIPENPGLIECHAKLSQNNEFGALINAIELVYYKNI